MNTTHTNLGKENATGLNQQGPKANTPVQILTASSIIGNNVVNIEKEFVGNVKDVMLNIRTGKIQYFIIEFGGFMGFSEKLFAIPFEALKLDTENKSYILDINRDFLEKAPGFDKEHWPETNDHDYTEVNTHWNAFI